MAVFLEINDNKVTASIVLDEQSIDELIFPDSEPVGQTYIASLGITGYWLQTSPEGLYRGCYAGIGYSYNPDVMPYGEFLPPVEPAA